MIAGAALLVGCGGGGVEYEEAAPAADAITIVFENPQFEDATVYIDSETGGTRRLGRVSGNSSEQFRAPLTAEVGFTIIAYFTALGEIESDVIVASAGDTVVITASSAGGLIYSIRR